VPWEVVSRTALGFLRAGCRHSLCCGEQRARARQAGHDQGGSPYCGRARHIYDYVPALAIIKYLEVFERDAPRLLSQGQTSVLDKSQKKMYKEWTRLSMQLEKCRATGDAVMASSQWNGSRDGSMLSCLTVTDSRVGSRVL
jgi:hypothetical protein